MKIVKIFGVVMAVHAAVFMFVFAIPGCRSTGRKASAPAPAAAEASPMASPVDAGPSQSYNEQPQAGVRFSPTRPESAAAVAAQSEAVPAAAVQVTHTVVKGDNLWAIARKHGTTVRELAAANKLRSDATLQLGQKLVIPAKSAAPASSGAAPASAGAAPARSASASPVVHTVKAGETLGGIARKYQVSIGEIATTNNIADPRKIRVGQELRIPGAQAPAARAAAAPAPAAPAPAPTFTPAPAPAPTFSPIIGAPAEPAPSQAPSSSPITAAPDVPQDAPVINVEDTGAPRFE